MRYFANSTDKQTHTQTCINRMALVPSAPGDYQFFYHRVCYRLLTDLFVFLNNLKISIANSRCTQSVSRRDLNPFSGLWKWNKTGRLRIPDHHSFKCTQTFLCWKKNEKIIIENLILPWQTWCSGVAWRQRKKQPLKCLMITHWSFFNKRWI